MPQEKYEGWSNQETWWIAQHIDNDQQTLEEWSNQTARLIRETGAHARIRLADDLKHWVEVNNPMRCYSGGKALYTHLMEIAISGIDWYELADHYLANAQDMAQHSELEPQTGNTIVDCCTRCGGPIDHNEPHTYCQNCA